MAVGRRGVSGCGVCVCMCVYMYKRGDLSVHMCVCDEEKRACLTTCSTLLTLSTTSFKNTHTHTHTHTHTQNKTGDKLLYHGKPLATAPGSAYILMIPNRAVTHTHTQSKDGKHTHTHTHPDKEKASSSSSTSKQIFVVPVGPWINFQRVADAVDVPTSIKEAEALMKGEGGGKGRKKKVGQQERETH